MTSEQIYNQWVKDCENTKTYMNGSWIPSPIMVCGYHVHTEITNLGFVRVYSLSAQGSKMTIRFAPVSQLDQGFSQPIPPINVRFLYMNYEMLFSPQKGATKFESFKIVSEMIAKEVSNFTASLMFL